MEGGLNRQATTEYIEGLFADRDALVDAIVADGWPQEMARAGLRLHRQTWDVDRLAEAVDAELSAVVPSPRHRIVWPSRVHHIWPAMPGAGITPVLVGMLLGIEQRVRPSSRGRNVAAYAARSAPWELIEPGGGWEDADLVVVSGTDETVRSVRETMAGRGRVVGYDHRVSFTVVDDAEQVDLEEVAGAVGRDVVMWHQQGCFSTRAVLFCGPVGRRREFARLLAAAIAKWEETWGAEEVDEASAAERAQAMGVAQMQGEVFCEGVGFVALTEEAFDGRRPSIHSVTVHPVEGPEGLDEAVGVPGGDLQAAALGGGGRRRGEWVEALCQLGVTRICAVGRLQAPPADWWHDGWANALSWGRVVTIG